METEKGPGKKKKKTREGAAAPRFKRKQLLGSN